MFIYTKTWHLRINGMGPCNSQITLFLTDTIIFWYEKWKTNPSNGAMKQEFLKTLEEKLIYTHRKTSHNPVF